MQKPIAGSIRKKGNYYYYTFQKNGKRYLDVSLKEGEYRNAIKKLTPFISILQMKKN